jgi:hypothetical protein
MPSGRPLPMTKRYPFVCEHELIVCEHELRKITIKKPKNKNNTFLILVSFQKIPKLRTPSLFSLGTENEKPKTKNIRSANYIPTYTIFKIIPTLFLPQKTFWRDTAPGARPLLPSFFTKSLSNKMDSCQTKKILCPACPSEGWDPVYSKSFLSEESCFRCKAWARSRPSGVLQVLRGPDACA